MYTAWEAHQSSGPQTFKHLSVWEERLCTICEVTSSKNAADLQKWPLTTKGSDQNLQSITGKRLLQGLLLWRLREEVSGMTLLSNARIHPHGKKTLSSPPFQTAAAQDRTSGQKQLPAGNKLATASVTRMGKNNYYFGQSEQQELVEFILTNSTPLWGSDTFVFASLCPLFSVLDLMTRWLKMWVLCKR